MKTLKAKRNYLNKKIFLISDLTFIRTATPLPEILNGEDMIEPIQIIKHNISLKYCYDTLFQLLCYPCLVYAFIQ